MTAGSAPRASPCMVSPVQPEQCAFWWFLQIVQAHFCLGEQPLVAEVIVMTDGASDVPD